MAAEDRQDLKPLPFLEAFNKYRDGSISWEEYIHHLLAQRRGAEVREDNLQGIHHTLLETDPFGYCIWCWSGRSENSNIDEDPIGRCRFHRFMLVD